MNDLVIVRALVNLIISINLSDEEEVDAGFASTAFEDVMAALDELSGEERSVIIEIIRELAENERSPERRQALEEIPESFGLVEDGE